jgi:hypothetical protein
MMISVATIVSCSLRAWLYAGVPCVAQVVLACLLIYTMPLSCFLCSPQNDPVARVPITLLGEGARNRTCIYSALGSTCQQSCNARFMLGLR